MMTFLCCCCVALSISQLPDHPYFCSDRKSHPVLGKLFKKLKCWNQKLKIENQCCKSKVHSVHTKEKSPFTSSAHLCGKTQVLNAAHHFHSKTAINKMHTH